jgi:hypothetical protein
VNPWGSSFSQDRNLEVSDERRTPITLDGSLPELQIPRTNVGVLRIAGPALLIRLTSVSRLTSRLERKTSLVPPLSSRQHPQNLFQTTFLELQAAAT